MCGLASGLPVKGQLSHMAEVHTDWLRVCLIMHEFVRQERARPGSAGQNIACVCVNQQACPVLLSAALI